MHQQRSIWIFALLQTRRRKEEAVLCGGLHHQLPTQGSLPEARRRSRQMIVLRLTKTMARSIWKNRATHGGREYCAYSSECWTPALKWGGNSNCRTHTTKRNARRHLLSRVMTYVKGNWLKLGGVSGTSDQTTNQTALQMQHRPIHLAAVQNQQIPSYSASSFCFAPGVFIQVLNKNI